MRYARWQWSFSFFWQDRFFLGDAQLSAVQWSISLPHRFPPPHPLAFIFFPSFPITPATFSSFLAHHYGLFRHRQGSELYHIRINRRFDELPELPFFSLRVRPSHSRIYVSRLLNQLLKLDHRINICQHRNRGIWQEQVLLFVLLIVLSLFLQQ